MGRSRSPLDPLRWIAARLRRAVAGTDEGDGDDDAGDAGGSVWNAVTRGQAEGRLAEAGGLTVSEQADEIRDVEERAEEYRDARR